MATEEDSNKWTLRIVYLITFLNQGCMFIYLQYVPFIFTGTFELDKLHFSYLQSAYAFTQLCVAPMLGRLADKVGTRTVLFICLTSSFLAHFVLGSANSLTMCFISRAASLLQDVMPVTQMIITDVVPEKDRSAALGRSMLPFSLGMVIGPFIGGFIAEKLGFQACFLITFWIPLLCLVLALTFLPRSTKHHKEGKDKKDESSGQTKMTDLLQLPGVAYLLILRFLSVTPNLMVGVNFNIISVDVFGMTASGMGMMFSAFGVVSMVTHGFLIEFVTNKISTEQLFRYIPPILVVLYILLSLSTTIPAMIISVFSAGVLVAFIENLTLAKVTKLVPKSDTSIMVGMATSVMHGAMTLSPALGGYLLNVYGWPSMGQFGVVCCILSTTLTFLYQ